MTTRLQLRRLPAFRFVAALISPHPPVYARFWFLVLLAVAWSVFLGPMLEPTPGSKAALTLQLQSDGGPWRTPPVPNATGFMKAEIQVATERGLGWSARTCSPTAQVKGPGAAPPTVQFGEIFDLWLGRLDAADMAAVASVPAGVPVAEQREVLAALAARERLHQGDPGWRGFTPLELVTGGTAQSVGRLVCRTPQYLVLLAFGLSALRRVLLWQYAVRPGAALGACYWCEDLRVGVPEDAPCPACGELLPSAMLRLERKCPACRYDRAGLPDEAKCPECGRLPAEILHAGGYDRNP